MRADPKARPLPSPPLGLAQIPPGLLLNPWHSGLLSAVGPPACALYTGAGTHESTFTAAWVRGTDLCKGTPPPPRKGISPHPLLPKVQLWNKAYLRCGLNLWPSWFRAEKAPMKTDEA